jgi:HSP20 family molecular chaperone IbpA
MLVDTNPYVPYDMYESEQEIVIIMPLWWVKKESLNLKIEDYKLLIQWERELLNLKDSLIPIKEECYWWKLEQRIDLPPQIYFDKIHSKLTPENILQIIIPKALVPEKIVLEIEK